MKFAQNLHPNHSISKIGSNNITIAFGPFLSLSLSLSLSLINFKIW